MPYPFELDEGALAARLDEMAASFVEYGRFQAAYEVLKRHTRAFAVVDAASLWAALRRTACAWLCCGPASA